MVLAVYHTTYHMICIISALLIGTVIESGSGFFTIRFDLINIGISVYLNIGDRNWVFLLLIGSESVLVPICNTSTDVVG